MSTKRKHDFNENSTESYLLGLADQWLQDTNGHQHPPHIREYFADDPVLTQRPGLWRKLTECIQQLQQFDSFDSSFNQDKWLPKIPGYRVIEEIGRGGMGVVYKAMQLDLQREVAIKFISNRLASRDDRRRFLREAKNVAQLTHPGIVNVHTADEVDGVPFFVMEYLPEKTLADMWQGKPTPMEVACACIEISEAVQFAHDNEIIHRDLKPSNVLVDSNGALKVADFGLAKKKGADATITLSGMPVGTASYMSPEQLKGHATALSDVYSLGAILYTGLTRRPPVMADSLAAAIQEINDRDPLPPRALDTSVPDDLQTICLKALSKNPLERYESAGDFASDLSRFVKGMPIHAKPITPIKRFSKWCRRNPIVSGLLALFLISLVVGASASTWFALKFRRQRDVALEFQQKTEAEKRLSMLAAFNANYARIRDELDEGLIDSAYDRLEGIQSTGTHDGWETRYLLSRLYRSKPSQVLAEGYWGFVAAALNDSQRFLCTCDASGQILVWDLQRNCVAKTVREGQFDMAFGRDLHFLEQPQNLREQFATCVVWSPKHQAFVTGHSNGNVAVVPVDGGDLRTIYQHTSSLTAICAVDGGVLFGDVDGQLVRAESMEEGPLRLQPSRSRRYSNQITTLTPLVEAGRVAVGVWDGTVSVVNVDDLQEITSTQYESPIWAIADVSVDSDPQMAIADGSQNVHLATMSGHGIVSERMLLRRPNIELLSNVHALSFDRNRSQLIAADDLGRISFWDLSNSRHLWTASKGVRQLTYPDYSPFMSLKERHPVCFKRSVAWAGVLDDNDVGFTLTCGEDAAVKLWQTVSDPYSGIGGEIANVQLGPQPCIEFDAARTEWLYAGNQEGELLLVDLDREVIVSAVEVSKRPIKAITLDSNSGRLFVLDDQGMLSGWRVASQSEATMVKVCQRYFSDPLISICASPDGQHLAGVTATSQLQILRAEDLSLVAEEALSSDRSRPLSGCVAFDPTGDQLVAAGAGQYVSVYNRIGERFEKQTTPLHSAGRGVLAAQFNPRHPGDILIGQDHTTSYTQTPRGHKQRHVYRLSWRTAKNVRSRRIRTTRDGKRMVSLETGGTLAFFDTDSTACVYRLPVGGRFDFDFALDRDESRIAVASDQGALAVLSCKQSNAIGEDVELQESRWLLTDVVDFNHDDRIGVDPYFVESTDRSELYLAYTDRRSVFGEERNANVLRWNDDALRDSGWPPATLGKAPLMSGSLAVSRSLLGHPQVAYATWCDRDARTSRLHLSRWIKAGQWTTSVVTEGDNSGFSPKVLYAGGNPAPFIVHYSFNGYHLRLASPTGQQKWTDARLTARGVLHSGWDALFINDELHVVHALFRVSQDPAKEIRYGTWRPGQDLIAYQGSQSDFVPALSWLGQHNDGRLVAVCHKQSGFENIESPLSFCLRTGERWNLWMRLPSVVQDTREIMCTLVDPRSGYPAFLQYNSQGKAILWSSSPEGWQAELISDDVERPSVCHAVRLQSELGFVIGRQADPAYLKLAIPE